MSASEEQVAVREEAARAAGEETEAARAEVTRKGQAARWAARELAARSSWEKNEMLFEMARSLRARAADVLDANRADVEDARRAGVPPALLDRLALSEGRISAMADGVAAVAELPDPVGRVLEGRRLYNGLKVERRSVPLGVVGMIYEARPNVTVDAAALGVKSGNAVLLRGGSEALRSNRALVGVLAEAGGRSGLPEGAIGLLVTPGRASAHALMRARGLVDVLVPRGGEGLIKTVVREAEVPVIETGAGNCHVYVDADAQLASAAAIVVNAKTHRPSVCNAMETLLVHENVAEPFLKKVAPELSARGVRLKGCARTVHIVAGTAAAGAEPAADEDWATEYLAPVLAVRVVRDLDEALDHIDRYGSGHSEAIVTDSYETAETFLDRVDAAAVYVNASTRFTDGYEFGLGAEIGISTQKLHARGPMGLEALTTTKYVVRGAGQVRA